MNGRIESLDVTKGFLLIVVLLSHGCGFLFAGEYLTASYMAAFFFMAGYVHKTANRDYVLLLKRRAQQLLVPYMSWGVALIILSGLDKNFYGEFSFLWLIKRIAGLLYSRYGVFPYGTDPNIFFLEKGGALWFITAMFCSYALFYIALYIIELPPPPRGGVRVRIIEVISMFIVVSIWLNHFPVLMPWSLDTAFTGAIFMLAGYFVRCKEKSAGINKFERCTLVAIIGTFYCMLIKYNSGTNMSVRFYGSRGDWSVLLFLLIGIMGSFLYMELGYLFCNCSWARKFLLDVSRCAFPLMALQFEIYSILDRVMPVISFSNRYMAYAYGLAKAGLNLLICMITHYLLRFLIRCFAKIKE